MASADTATKAKENGTPGRELRRRRRRRLREKWRNAKTRKAATKPSKPNAVGLRVNRCFSSPAAAPGFDMGIDPWPSSAGRRGDSAPPASWCRRAKRASRIRNRLPARWHLRPRGPGAARRAGELLHRDRRRLPAQHRRGPGTDDKLRRSGTCAGTGPWRWRRTEQLPRRVERRRNASSVVAGVSKTFPARKRRRAQDVLLAAVHGCSVLRERLAKGWRRLFETIACDFLRRARDECLTCPYHGWTTHRRALW